MLKKCLVWFSIFGIIICLSGCSSKDPFRASDLKGAELDDFLNSPMKYGPVFHNDYIKDVFYSSDIIEGIKVSSPKRLGTEKGIRNYAIIIEKGNVSTVLYFEGKKIFPNSEVYEYTFTKLEQGEITRYQNKMNPILFEIFPNEYFRQIALEIEDYEAGEPERAAERAERLQRDMEAIKNPYAYIKNSNFILREGIDDVRATIGEVFYKENLPEGITIDEPYKSGSQYVVEITIKAPSDVVKNRIYLSYDEKTKVSLITRIVMAGNRETQTANTFEEKYQVLAMLLTAMNWN